jgi:2-hydroxychromene-2-carboxylate isomerase
MKPTSLDFYFDYLSPFAFFSWLRIEKFCEQFELELTAHPVVFGKLLDHWGHMGPAEIPPKSQWVGRYCKRYAALEGFDYSPPKYHPFNPLPSLRMSLNQVSGNDQHAVISAIFKAGWTEGEDLGDVAGLISILEREGIDCQGFEQKIKQAETKNALISETDNAIARGVFGVPTMIIGGQLFWGNDQFDHMQLLLEGNDPVNPEELDSFTGRPRMIDRKAITGKS